MNLEVRHLQMIVAISETNGVTRASEKLFLTQSALSHQLREIETRLGTPLFHRLNKKMVLTQAGERVLSAARRILAELNEVETDVANLAASKQGSLRISTECYTCYHWLPEILKNFKQKFPAVEVKIVVEATRHPVPVLLEGKLDLAIVSNPENDKRLIFEPLFSDEMVVIMSPRHRLAGHDYVKVEDFNGENYFTYAALSENSVYRKFLSAANVQLGNHSQVHLTEAIIEMVKADLGIAVLAKWAVRKAAAEGAIVTKPLTRSGFNREWYAAYLKNDSLPEYFGEFIGQLAENVTVKKNNAGR
jgi:LysR family transcriptional regulator for metE and metH